MSIKVSKIDIYIKSDVFAYECQFKGK